MNTTQPQPLIPDTELAEIAKNVLGFPTLESRNRDSLDFRDVGVACLKEALEQAFLLGQSKAIAFKDPLGLYDTSRNVLLLQGSQSVDHLREFNPFTLNLKAIIDKEGFALVQLADGSFDKVLFESMDEDGDLCRVFRGVQSYHRWTAQGASYTSQDYDIVSLG